MLFSKKPPTTRLWNPQTLPSIAALLLGQSCDPIVSIDGAFFPAWMISLITGIAGSALIRQWLIHAGIDRHIAPRVVVYPCLALLITVSFWLLLYRQ